MLPPNHQLNQQSLCHYAIRSKLASYRLRPFFRLSRSSASIGIRANPKGKANIIKIGTCSDNRFMYNLRSLVSSRVQAIPVFLCFIKSSMKPLICWPSSSITSLFFEINFLKNDFIITGKVYVGSTCANVSAELFSGTDL